MIFIINSVTGSHCLTFWKQNSDTQLKRGEPYTESLTGSILLPGTLK